MIGTSNGAGLDWETIYSDAGQASIAMPLKVLFLQT
jgi:hypothetical protein